MQKSAEDEGDEELTIAMLTVLRRLYDEVLYSEQSCIEILMKAQFFRILDHTVLQSAHRRADSKSKFFVEMECLWVLQNVAYCCVAD